MGKKHAKRVLNVRCNCTDHQNHTFYNSRKYTYRFTSDDQKPGLVADAIARYRVDENIPAGLVVETTESTQHGV